MRILFLSPWFPYPPDNGIRIRLYNLLRVLGRRHAITLLSFVRPGEQPTPDKLSSYCQAIHTIPWRSFQPTRLKSFAGFFSRTPRSLVDTYSREMADLVRQVSASNKFDVVIASTIDTAIYALDLPIRVSVLEEANSMTRWMWDNYRTQASWRARARHWLTFKKFQRYERWLYSQFDACTMVSELDAQSVRDLLCYEKPLVIVPNCVDLDYYCGGQFEPQPNTLIFNGSLTYDANLDAMGYFSREIWPHIKFGAPSAALYVTGRSDGINAQSLQLGDGIALTGYLDDIRSAIAQAWVCVVPLRQGGGTRLKILEAMALGTPVVATSKGAEGLNVTHGKDILIADKPTEFAAQTIALLHDPVLRAHLAANARCLVETEYDWETSVKKLETLLLELSGGGSHD